MKELGSKSVYTQDRKTNVVYRVTLTFYQENNVVTPVGDSGGTAVTCVLRDAYGRELTQGSSVCSPLDTFVVEVGMALAFSRFLVLVDGDNVKEIFTVAFEELVKEQAKSKFPWLGFLNGE